MGIKIIAKNKRAFHEYHISEKFEAGIQLRGTEVKSIRAGKISLVDGWVELANSEAILRDVHISPYTHGNINNHADKRARKLLLHKKEIYRLIAAAEQKGYSIIPIKVYLKGQLVKVEISLAKGKKLHDKRFASKEKDANREMARAIRNHNKWDGVKICEPIWLQFKITILISQPALFLSAALFVTQFGVAPPNESSWILMSPKINSR